MAWKNRLDTFINPISVTVIGASERPGAWGSLIMESLLVWKYPGKIYPVNHHAKEVYGIRSFQNVESIDGPTDLAVIAIPEKSLEKTIEACGKKGFNGITIITSGFGEAVEGGKEREEALACLARSYGMHILGPNVSGTFNLHARFNASGSPARHLYPTSIAGICQGGYAVYDLMASASSKKMGVGRFIHTGNECDLQVTDFLSHFGEDPEIKAIIMYIETIRNGRVFIDVARKVAKKKPVIVYKGGKTLEGARAAHSHTCALSGRREIFAGVFKQAEIIPCPTMELLLPLAHALVERPPMRGKRVAIITMGGSWGVVLTDCLEEEGLTVPILSTKLQKRIKTLGMPERASTMNPVDIGAAGVMVFSSEILLKMGREILLSDEVDALILHGLGRPGLIDENSPAAWKKNSQVEKDIMLGYSNLEIETGLPVFLGGCLTPWESQAVQDLNEEGIRFINRLDEIASMLSMMHKHYCITSDPKNLF